jgi:predicted RecB family nuclease
VRRSEQGLHMSATDLTRFLGCQHATWLDLQVLDAGAPQPAGEADQALELLVALGTAHEIAHKQRLLEENEDYVEIETVFEPVARAEAAAATVAAMRRGVGWIYQAVLDDGVWGGQADFLVKVARPSALGSWSYEVHDTKLARSLKTAALLQMSVYAERLAQIQGLVPEHMAVVTGDGVVRRFRTQDVSAYSRRLKERVASFLHDAASDAPPVTEARPVAACASCRWSSRCNEEWRAQDDLSLVADLRGDHRQRLRESGVETVGALAKSPPGALPLTPAVSARLVEQAALQVAERESSAPSYVLLPQSADLPGAAPAKGLLRLPLRSEGDLYLDFEGDPYAEDGAGREYLAGLGDRTITWHDHDHDVPHDHEGFTALWAHDRLEERQLVVDLLERLHAQRLRFPDMHVYHYAPYEITALRRLTQQHRIHEAELQELLDAEVFIDLYAVVREGLRISKESYSIKKLEAFYHQGERADEDDAVTSAIDSVVLYERWLAEREDGQLQRLVDYNHDDVVSTYALHGWLEERRAELEKREGTQPLPRPSAGQPPERPSEEIEELRLVEQLVAAGRQDVADLVQWHRRESRAAYAQLKQYEATGDEKLVEDEKVLGGMDNSRVPVECGSQGRSTLYAYDVPVQECALEVGKPAYDVDTRKSAGTVHELDLAAGRLVLRKRGAPVQCRGLYADASVAPAAQQEALRRVAQDVLDCRPGLHQALLSRDLVPAPLPEQGETPERYAARLAVAVDGRVLAVQGPPGTGKTTLGAAVVRALLDAGRSVGVTAHSHAAIRNLLTAVGRPALHKCADEPSGLISTARSNDEVQEALRDGSHQLVGGTSWLWAREDMASSVDVLVIDEAGQFSLANAVAVTGAATSLVLLGDPQQLPQPVQAAHPGHAARSVLEHVLDGRPTLPATSGVFLDTSYRMHPSLTAFVGELMYEDRLRSAPDRSRQAVLPGGLVSGSGLRVVPVRTTGCGARSPREAETVHRLWTSLVGSRYVDYLGTQHVLTPDDVLVVTPFNAQVRQIAKMLPDARVGTVDRFQGQEAPVVLYSMTSSSADDAPRGLSFLLDLNRLNVALSRARALAVVTFSPALLDAKVDTPEQLRQANALCRLVETAQEVVLPTDGHVGTGARS